MYKDPESAFATFNFRGQATVGLDDILSHPIVKTSFAQEDVRAYLLRDKVFTSENSEIDFLQFKKFFFPQLMLIEDRAEGELQRKEESDLDTFNQMNNNESEFLFDSAQRRSQEERLKQEQESFIKERLAKLTNFLRDRFSKTWVSVRKAFLDLDVDKDGEISSEDIMRFFGDASNNLFDYFDLVKILQDLDGKQQGTLNYNDFCKWMGGAIHQSQGFYFRHDSVKNPPFEVNLEKMQQVEKELKKTAKKLSTDEIKHELGRKIEQQWKTLKSAFKALNLSKSGKIQRWELKFFCDHWGFFMADEQFDEIFKTFDIDQDNQISYQDMQKTFGSVLNPPENFYFRQDLKHKMLTNVCQVPTCSFEPIGYNVLCLMHTKQMRLKSMTILGQIKDKLGNESWEFFLDDLKEKAVSACNNDKNSDGVSVDFSFFTAYLMDNFGMRLSDAEQDILVKTFGAKSETEGARKLNLKPLMQLRNHETMTATYKQI